MRSLHGIGFLAVFAIVACEAAPPPSTAPTPPAATGTACLMTHICGCNLGCARVPLAASALHEGLRTTAQTGPYAGKEMLVTKEADAMGADVFALSDRDHSGACELETAQSKSLLGFRCATKDSGPVPGQACARGCD